MHDAYELSAFFSSADYELKEKVLLELCKRDPLLLLDIIRSSSTNIDYDELKSLVRSNQKIMAIKRYREMSGETLKESKAFIDAMPV